MAKKYLIFSLILAGTMVFADNENYDGQDVSGKSFSSSSLKNSSWVGTIATRTYYRDSNLTQSNFTNANLSGADFQRATISGVDFTNANLSGVYFLYVKGLTDVQLRSASDVTNICLADCDLSIFDLSGLNLSGIRLDCSELTNVNFKNSNLYNAFCEGATFINVNCNNTYINGGRFSRSNLEGTSFIGADLTAAVMDNTTLTNVNFTSAILSGVSFSGADFTDVVILGADLSSTVANGFTEAQLKQTLSYKSGNLQGVMFDYNNISKWDFSGQNLQNASFFSSRIANVNFTGADLRGAELTGTAGTPIYKNTIMSDGVIKNFSMASADDVLKIRKYVPATGGEMINAKISENSTISGGAALTIEQGSVLEIDSGKILSVSDGEIIFNIDTADAATRILLGENSEIVFGTDSKLTINIDGTISPDGSYTFTLIEAASEAQISGITKENSILNINGSLFDANKWSFAFDSATGSFNINVVPEPAEWAMIFGAVALGFAVYRRRK